MAQLDGLGLRKVSDVHVLRRGKDGCGGGRNTGCSLGRQTSGEVGPEVVLIMMQGIIQAPVRLCISIRGKGSVQGIIREKCLAPDMWSVNESA